MDNAVTPGTALRQLRLTKGLACENLLAICAVTQGTCPGWSLAFARCRWNAPRWRTVAWIPAELSPPWCARVTLVSDGMTGGQSPMAAC